MGGDALTCGTASGTRGRRTANERRSCRDAGEHGLRRELPNAFNPRMYLALGNDVPDDAVAVDRSADKATGASLDPVVACEGVVIVVRPEDATGESKHLSFRRLTGDNDEFAMRR